jgi:hypothetical protein
MESFTSSSSSDEDNFVIQIIQFLPRPRVFRDRSNSLMDHGLVIGLCIMIMFIIIL